MAAAGFFPIFFLLTFYFLWEKSFEVDRDSGTALQNLQPHIIIWLSSLMCCWRMQLHNCLAFCEHLKTKRTHNKCDITMTTDYNSIKCYLKCVRTRLQVRHAQEKNIAKDLMHFVQTSQFPNGQALLPFFLMIATGCAYQAGAGIHRTRLQS